MPIRRHAEIAGAGFSGLAEATAFCQRGDEGVRADRSIPTGISKPVMG